MAAHYTIKIITDFAAAHALRGYIGNCSNLHGHNWKLEVEVSATELNTIGIGMDFKDIKTAVHHFTQQFDHQNLNQISPFDEVNPTAENIACFFYKGIAETINNQNVRIKAVTLWETDRACVCYTED